MKARPFLAALLAAALALLSFGFAAWWLLLQHGPLGLQSQTLQLPLAARFVPRTAALSLHWLVEPDQAAAYARAVAPPRQRREAAAAVERLRDGAFAAAGLDYTSELAPWLGRESSLALLAAPDQPGRPAWVLALRSRDSAGARRFLQRFWQSRSLAGTDLQISSYRGMGLISGRGALLGQDPQPLATALINDDLVLIASGRGALEQALDVSQIDELNQAASAPLQQAVARLEHGVALLTARPEAMQAWLGLPPAATEAEATGQPLQELVAALQPSGTALALDALVQLRDPLPARPLGSGDQLLRALQQPAGSLALLSAPADLLAPPPGGDPAVDPWRTLLAPLFRQALAHAAGPLPALVASADQGPLLWADLPEGWLLGTPAATPSLEELQPQLAQQGYSGSPLESRGQTLQVWTRLRSRPVKGNPDQLQAELAGARAADGAWAWWGQGLAVLHQQHEGHQPPQERLQQLEALATPQAPVQWAMDAGTARTLLAGWTPWRLLNTLSSTPLTPVVDGAALSLDRDGAQPRALHLRARLELRR
ncbi:MAG: DUF3352 domain-containing protein [Vulcanococcus sp.]